MIYIAKGEEPPSLAVRRETGPIEWDVPADVKEDIRRALWIEQSGLCAFCCAKLPPVPQLQRIAHVEPRSVNAQRSLDYTNMALSCSSGRDTVGASTAQRDQSCDEKQGANLLPVHPYQTDCREKFNYLGNGMIMGVSDDAQVTIGILNLDCDRLRQARFKAMQGALVMKERIEASRWDQVYRTPVAPHLPEFWPAIASVA